MSHGEHIRKLAARMGKADSQAMQRILVCAMTDEEARFLLGLPASHDELAARHGLSEPEIEAKLLDLARRGLVMPSRKLMRFPYPETLHDNLLSSAPQYIPSEMNQHWTALYEDEGWAQELGNAHAASEIPARRTIPIQNSVPPEVELLPHENLAEIIEAHQEQITLRNCSCRVRTRSCIHPMEVCLRFGEGAEYDLARGSGRRISADEALSVALEAGCSGLLPTVANRSRIEALDFICFCCGCCCQVIDSASRVGAIERSLAPSRFLTKIDIERCNGCGKCPKFCSTGAVEMEEMIGFDEPIAVIDPAKCVGCGVCVPRCPEAGAMWMEPVRRPDFIPENPFGP
jgi:ferredoxin